MAKACRDREGEAARLHAGVGIQQTSFIRSGINGPRPTVVAQSTVFRKRASIIILMCVGEIILRKRACIISMCGGGRSHLHAGGGLIIVAMFVTA